MLLILVVETHIVKEITNQEKATVSGYVNQAKQLAIPFQKCFKAEV
jgi:hypothetical protein